MTTRFVVALMAVLCVATGGTLAAQSPVTSAPGRSSGNPAADAPLLSTVPTVTGGMPAPAQMAGLPLQVGDLPPGTVAVRLVRGGFADRIANHQVELHLGDGGSKIVNVPTNDEGRAIFSGLPVGDLVRATAVVDGERLESQIFALPPKGGVRVMLVAGVGASAPASPPLAGPTMEASAAPMSAPTGWSGTRVVILTVLLGSAGVVALVGTRKRNRTREVPAAKSTPRAGNAADRDALFARLIEIEDQWEAGQLTARRYHERREPLMQRLEESEQESGGS